MRLEIGRVLKNPVANHSSRIVCAKGTEVPISKCFPNEQLFIVQSGPWYADIANYLVTGKIPKGWNKHDKDRFLHVVKFTFGMILICLDIILIRLLGDAFQIMRLEVSCLFAMIKPVEGTLVEK